MKIFDKLVVVFLVSILWINAKADTFVFPSIDRLKVTGVVENSADIDSPWRLEGKIANGRWRDFSRKVSGIKFNAHPGMARFKPMRALSDYYLEIEGTKHGRVMFSFFMPHENSILIFPGELERPFLTAEITDEEFSQLCRMLIAAGVSKTPVHSKKSPRSNSADRSSKATNLRKQGK